MRAFQNYHRHSMYTNIKIADSTAKNEDYAKRAQELGHGIISSVEHGFQGRYIEGYELAKQYGLKFLFGTEAYWVKDRLEKDRTNAHIVLLAKNENGRQAINDILAEANITGYYYQPRLDLSLILSLPKDDVWVTTACVAFWRYDDDQIVIDLHNHFGRNFFLEVQYHNTESQKELNKKIINLANRYNIQIIMGCDSHYISEEKSWERDEYIKSSGIVYEDEQGWYLDYPDGDTAFNRFVEQGILTKAQIEDAIANTNTFLQVEEYNNPCFTKDIKMPSLYPHLSQEEKDKLFCELVWTKWEEEKKKVPIEKHDHYVSEIQKELDIIIITKHADYFLLDYELVRKAKNKGGVITPSGRGSGASFYVNKLLGFTKIDRISASVKMYPERFMSATRILESKSLADLDLNLANPEVFFEAQKELLGEQSAYQMLAYGTMKTKSAWKMYARAKGIDAETANVVSEQIEKYETKLKHAEEDEKDDIDLMDFVESQYHEYLNDSLQYMGIIAQVSPHPCFKAGTLIKTKDGLKNIEEIKAGELVFTHNKRYQKVIATMKSKSEEILKIKANNIFTMATENHPFYVRSINAGYYKKEDGTKAWRRNYSSPYWEEAKNITKNHVIGFPINQESSMLTEEGLPITEYNFWWFIGRYIGDGWTFCRKENGDYRVVLSVGKIKTDLSDVQEKISGMFKFRISEERTAYKIYINNKKLYDFVEKFGKYAYGKHLPSGVIDLPENLLKGFLDGYLSADGYVETRKNGNIRYSYTTTSKKLAFDIQACVHKIYKMPCYLAYIKPRIGTIEGRTVNCREKWVGVFKKNSTIKDMSFYEDGFIWHKFRSAEKIEHNDFVYNLEVEEDHSYVADGMAVHNCASVVYSGNVRKEIGLVLVKSTSGKKETLCAIMDGKWAEDYKFLKNDLLKVSVVEVIDKSFKRIGMEIPDENELIEMCKNNQGVWDVYGHGFTLGINQVEQNSTRHRAMKYKPKNISELSAFVAAVRPGFKSMYSIFEARERFDYGIPVFDNLIQTKEMPNSFLLYQEMSMAALNFAGIQMSECYEVVKNISKKRVEKVTKYKEQFLEGFSKKIVEVEHRTNEEAHGIADKVWQIIEDSTRYQFNASHSYSVAMDSLYGAWLKSQHPLAFYEVFLTVLDEKGSKDRMKAVRVEAENAYKIRFAPLRFRQDNRKITSDEATNSIWGTLKSIKGFGTAIADQMYSMKDMKFDSFIDFLVYLEENGIMCSKIEDLIKVQYFSEFGGGQKLLTIYKEFSEGKNRYNRKHKDDTKAKRLIALYEFELSLVDENFPLIQQMEMEQEILGYTQVIMPIDKRFVFVQDINTTYAPRVEVYCLANAKTESMKIDRRTFGSKPIELHDILLLKKWKSKPQIKYVNGKYEPACGNTFHKSSCKGCAEADGCSMKEWWIEDYDIRNDIKTNT